METTLNNADDLDLKKTLNAENWRALRAAGAQVNERFLGALGDGAPGLPDPTVLQAVVMPSIHDGQRAPGLRFGDPRVVALLGAVCAFDTVFNGLTNAALRARMAPALRPRLLERPGHLRPAPPSLEGDHRARPWSPPLPGHALRQMDRHLLHPPRHPRRRPDACRPRLDQPASSTRAAPRGQRLARFRQGAAYSPPRLRSRCMTFCEGHLAHSTDCEPALRRAHRTPSISDAGRFQPLRPTESGVLRSCRPQRARLVAKLASIRRDWFPKACSRSVMIYSFPAKAMFSTVLQDCRRGPEHALDDEYDQV